MKNDKKIEDIIVYKQDIMDSNGKLNAFGALLIIGVCITCLHKAFDILNDIIVDKDKLN